MNLVDSLLGPPDTADMRHFVPSKRIVPSQFAGGQVSYGGGDRTFCPADSTVWVARRMLNSLDLSVSAKGRQS